MADLVTAASAMGDPLTVVSIAMGRSADNELGLC
jgi:hypothetical protein